MAVPARLSRQVCRSGPAFSDSTKIAAKRPAGPNQRERSTGHTAERAVTALPFSTPGSRARAQRPVHLGLVIRPHGGVCGMEGPAKDQPIPPTTPDRCPSQPACHSSRRPVITYRPNSPRWNAAKDRPRRAGSPRASCRFRRFPVNLEEYEPEVLDPVEQAVQGGLVGSGGPQHRRITHHAHRRVVEGGPHPRTRGTADGDHVSAIGYFPGLRHCYREPPDRVSCPHPFRVCRPVVAWGRDNPGPELGQDAGRTFVPGTSEPGVIGFR